MAFKFYVVGLLLLTELTATAQHAEEGSCPRSLPCSQTLSESIEQLTLLGPDLRLAIDYRQQLIFHPQWDAFRGPPSYESRQRALKNMLNQICSDLVDFTDELKLTRKFTQSISPESVSKKTKQKLDRILTIDEKELRTKHLLACKKGSGLEEVQLSLAIFEIEELATSIRRNLRPY